MTTTAALHAHFFEGKTDVVFITVFPAKLLIMLFLLFFLNTCVIFVYVHFIDAANYFGTN